MSLATSIAIVVGVLAVVKLADAAALMWCMIFSRPSSDGVTIEAPIFDWAKRQRIAVRFTVNTLFRAPVLVCLSVTAIFACDSATHVILLLAAGLIVPVALNIVLVLLLAAVLERSRGTPVYPVSGMHINRAGNQERSASNAMDPVLIVPLTAGSFILAYAALYHTVSLIDPAAFHVAHIGSVANHIRLDVADSLYFSTVTGATVGFGDIYPITHVAQLMVASQILMTAAGLTLFVGYLLRQRPTLRIAGLPMVEPERPQTVVPSQTNGEPRQCHE